jgi:hypothetical protein
MASGYGAGEPVFAPAKKQDSNDPVFLLPAVPGNSFGNPPPFPGV